MTDESLVEGLSRYMAAAGPNPTIEFVGMLAGGWSVDTYHVRVDCRDLVLRLAGREHPLQTNAAREARIMRHAGAAGVPVPTVIAAEDDPSWLGAPFSLVELISGTAPIGWSRRRMTELLASADAEDLLRELIDLTIAIRDIPLTAAAEPASTIGMSADQYSIRADVDRWRAMLSATSRPRPVLDLAGRWLADNAPGDSEVVFQHHDFRLGNLLVNGHGQAAAVVDWEFAGAGDPLCDIGYAAQPYTLGKLLSSAGFISVEPDPSAWVRREFLTRSDSPIDPARLDWFVALGIFKMAVALVVPADRWGRPGGTLRDAWLELPILSLSEDLIAAIRNLP
jgi:aminoglycoside phosphotransferase (APT) family kinase protein